MRWRRQPIPLFNRLSAAFLEKSPILLRLSPVKNLLSRSFLRLHHTCPFPCSMQGALAPVEKKMVFVGYSLHSVVIFVPASWHSATVLTRRCSLHFSPFC